MLAHSVAGQTTPQGTEVKGKPITFEVSSVKLNKSDTGFRNGPTVDGYNTKNFPLIILIGITYEYMDFSRIKGFPESFRTDSYDINAKVAESDIPEWKKQDWTTVRGAVQALLQDRFKLKAHEEMREAPAYALVVAKNGPKFKEAIPGSAYPDGFKNRKAEPVLGIGEKFEPGSEHGRLVGQAGTITDLASNLTLAVGRPVIDRTGLAGKYDFSIPISQSAFNPNKVQAEDSSEASIFTTLEDSLGLRLEPIKAPIKFLIIDHIERPAEN